MNIIRPFKNLRNLTNRLCIESIQNKTKYQPIFKKYSTSPILLSRPFYEEKDIENIVLSKLKEVRPDHNLSIHSKFYDDLEMNDFDRMDFILKIEVHFAVNIGDDEAVDAERVRDLTWALFRRLMVLSAGMNIGGILNDPEERVIAINEHEPHDDH